ncbi:MAG: tetratricopeptide repeat protein [Thermoanaerobaculia bacterium]
MKSLFAALLIVPSLLLAQEHTMPAAPPATLEAGLGDLHRPVSTKNAMAQQFFDQGLRYVYAFNHEQAVASFQHAGELDPNLAIAWWGAALALGPNINMDVDPDREKQAYDAVQTAMKKSDNASAKERDMITTLAKRYTIDPAVDLKKLGVDYSKAMGELTKKYPNDLDIATLYAESLMDLRPWKFWTADGKPAEGTEEIVTVLESVLKRDPNHLGANHYYIHATEASPNPGRALKSAKRLETLAPNAGHLVHMPAHVYERVGNFAGAAAANEAGARADREFIKKYGSESMYAGMYFNHNLDFGAASYAMIGDYANAKRLADEVSGNAIQLSKMMSDLEAASTDTMKVLLRFSKWSDVLQMPEGPGPFSNAFRHAARGIAFARMGDVAAAEVEQKLYEAARVSLADQNMIFQNSPKAIALVASELLAGRIAEAKGNRDAAVEAYRRAAAAEDALSYDEPADWFYPTRETLGGALLRAGKFADAEKVFREDLVRNPENPRSLFGLSEALKAQKKPSAKFASSFKKLWKGAALHIEDL